MEEKFIEIKGFKIRYLEGGEGNNLLFLPGVYTSCDDYYNLIKLFEKRYKVYGLDLPGFGHSQKINSFLKIEDYTDIVRDFIKELKLKHITVAAHSAGGLAALNLKLNRNIIKNIVIIDSAGINNNLRFYEFLKLLFLEFLELYKEERFKLKAKVFMGFSIRIIKSLFDKNLKVTIENGLKYNFGSLKNIKVPVLILWGENDKITPLSNAYELKEKLKYSRLVIIKNSTHVWCLTQPEKVIRIMEIEKF